MFKGTRTFPRRISKTVARNGGQDNALPPTLHAYFEASPGAACPDDAARGGRRSISTFESNVLTERDVGDRERRCVSNTIPNRCVRQMKPHNPPPYAER